MGVDVSKNTLDVYRPDTGEHIKIENTEVEINGLCKVSKKKNVLVACMLELITILNLGLSRFLGNVHDHRTMPERQNRIGPSWDKFLCHKTSITRVKDRP